MRFLKECVSLGFVGFATGKSLNMDWVSEEVIVTKNSKSSLLKTLREKKRISRSHLSKLTRLSTYQIEGVEGKNTENILNRFLACAKALGYKPGDILSAMDQKGGPAFLKGAIGKPLHEKNLGAGIKLSSYLSQHDNFLGLLELEGGRSLEMGRLYVGDIVFGIVWEGTLVIDLFAKQSVYKKDTFFIFPGKLPVKFLNEDGLMRITAVLLFSAKFPAEAS
jgi:transcriptional regulator with XRE-family HTH domain